jgi:hypothetical protein
MDDVYRIEIERYGPLGTEQTAGRVTFHAVPRGQLPERCRDIAEAFEMFPSDRAVITLTRGQ